MYEFRRRLFLTGTPVMNNLDEFTNLLRFLHPEIRDFPEFMADKTRRDRLTRAVVLRRLANEVDLKLPERVEYLIKIPMTAFQKSMYQWALTRESSGNILAALRKVCNHPYLFNGVEPEPFLNGEHLLLNSAKLIVLDGLLQRTKEEKVLVFSTSTQFLDIVQDFLDLRQINYERLDGSVRGEDRYKTISNFNSSSQVSVFLLSVRAGGIGLNLTAASVVITLDEDFNPHFTRQAIARAYRQGQQKPVTVYRLICQNTLDEVVYRRGVAKLKLSADVLNEHDVLTKEEQAQLIAFGLSKLDLPPPTDQEDVTSKIPPRASRSPPIDFAAYDVQTLLANAERVGDRKEADDVSTVTDIDQPDAKDMEVMRQFRPKADQPSRTTARDRNRRFDVEDRKLILKVMEQNRKKRLQELQAFPSLAIASDDEELSGTPSELTSEPDASAAILRHTRGDLLNPEISVGTLSLVLLPVASDGSFISTRFGALQKQRFPDAVEYLKKARKARALKMGDLHLLELPQDQGGVTALGLSVCLSAVDSGLDLQAFGAAVKKIPRRFTVHIPRLGDRSGQFYAVERSLQQNVVSRGVEVVIYYFSRPSAEPPSKKPRVTWQPGFKSVRDFFAAKNKNSGHPTEQVTSDAGLRFADDIPQAVRTALGRCRAVFKTPVMVVSSSASEDAHVRDLSREEFMQGGFSVTSKTLEQLMMKHQSR
jgi:hypothetical protein